LAELIEEDRLMFDLFYVAKEDLHPDEAGPLN